MKISTQSEKQLKSIIHYFMSHLKLNTNTQFNYSTIMKLQLKILFSILIYLSASICLTAQSEVVYQQAGVNLGFMPESANLTTQLGNTITLGGNNRYLSKIDVGLSRAASATGNVIIEINIWADCPGAVAGACGSNGVELIKTFTSVSFDITDISTSGSFVNFFLPSPIDLSNISNDKINVSISSNRGTAISYFFGNSGPTIGSRDNSRASQCAFPTQFGCSQTVNPLGGSNLTLRITAIPEPCKPATIDITNIGSETISLSDVYIGDANFFPTSSITISPSVLTCADVGDNDVTLTITYPDGEVTMCTTTVTVVDNTNYDPPTAICQNFNVEITNGTSIIFPEDINGGSSAACVIDELLINGMSSVTIPSNVEEPQLVTLTVEDNFGLSASCDAIVNVIKDLCPEGDDGLDSDGGGLPDACDCNPFDAFDDNIILQNSSNTAMDFDGIDDELTIPNTPSLIPTNNNSMTFEAWIYPDDVNGIQAIASSSGSVLSYNFGIYLLGDKLVALGSTSGGGVQSNASIPAGTWTHVAIVYTANTTSPSLSTTKIYIDGQLDNTITESFEPTNLGDPILLGNFEGFDWSFDGMLDEVRFWNESRTLEQIQFLKDRELSATEAGLAAYYDFSNGFPMGDNMALNAVEDLSANSYDATLVSMAQTGSGSNWVNGEINIDRFYREELSPCSDCPERIAMDFDGLDDEIIIPNHPNLVPTNNNSMTFEAWVKPDLGTGNKCLVSSANSLSVYNLAIYTVFGNKIRVTATGGQLVTSNAGIPAGQWSHVAVVFTAIPSNPTQSKIEIFINGQLDNTMIDDFELANLGNPIILGDINGADWSYDGDMDDVRFWSEARLASEIMRDMNAELYGDEENLAAYYNFNYGTPDDDNTALTFVTDQTVRQQHGALSGFARTGFSSNWVSDANSSAPVQNAALNFDGVDDYLSITWKEEHVATSTNAVTVEAWIYPEKVSGVNMIYSSGVFPNINHQIFLDGTQLFVTGDGLAGLLANTTVPTNVWTHIAVVFDQTETRLYINGTLDNIRVQTLPSSIIDWNTSFGSQSNGEPQSWNYLGYMDDIRIWNSARTTEEILDNILGEKHGNEEGMAVYYNANDGVPYGDNTSISELKDLSGKGNSALMNGFANTGNISNFVLSPFRLSDRDTDGLPDRCDNCVRQQNLLLQNMELDGIHDATEKITLGEGVNFANNAILILRAPITEVPHFLDIPSDVTIRLIGASCEE